jgi:hypothetical protein
MLSVRLLNPAQCVALGTIEDLPRFDSRRPREARAVDGAYYLRLTGRRLKSPLDAHPYRDDSLVLDAEAPPMLIVGLTVGFVVVLLAGLWLLLPGLLEEDNAYQHSKVHGQEREEANRPQTARAARA